MTKREARAMLWRASIYCIERRTACSLTEQGDWDDWNWAGAALALLARRIYARKEVPSESHNAEQERG